VIRLVEVKGYKCLRNVRQPLEPFQILVGPNASGKSTLLDVIGFLRDLLLIGVEETVRKRARSLSELVWNQQGDSFELALECILPRDLQEKRPPYKTARYEVRVGHNPKGSLAVTIENLWLIREKGAVNPRRQQVVSEPRRHSPKGWRKVMSRNPEGRIYIRSETTDWNFSLRPAMGKVGLSVIPEEERFEAALWVRQLLEKGVQTLTLQSQQMRRPCPPDAPAEFQPDGSNLPIAIKYLHADQTLSKRWLAHVQTVLPDLKDIVVKEREEDRYHYIEVHTQTGLSIPSWLLSDGTLRFLALTLIAYLPTSGTVYLIEEPENGIHPRAIESVYQSLSSVYDAQILCATHSPILLNIVEPRQLLCFIRDESGATNIVRGDQHPKLKRWQKEVSLGDLLASGVLG